MTTYEPVPEQSGFLDVDVPGTPPEWAGDRSAASTKIERTCPVHGTWIWPTEFPAAAEDFVREHADCRWPPEPSRTEPHPKLRRWPS